MVSAEKHERYLRWAEMQILFVQHAHHALYANDFQSAEIGRLATDQLVGWNCGHHALSREEITLSSEEAVLAAAALEQTVTFNLAVWIRKAFQDVVPNARNDSDWSVRSAFEISRLIRNAFTHNPADPHWNIDPCCRNQRFAVDDLIFLDTSNIDGQPFDWHHYGGPLALFRLSQWVRQHLLKVIVPVSDQPDGDPR